MGGIGCAVVAAIGLLFSARSSRAIGPTASLAAILGVGFVLDLPLVVLTFPQRISEQDMAWLVISGLGNVAALLLAYAAFRAGPLGTGAALLATEGAFAAVVAIVLGAHVPVSVLLGLGITVAGVMLASGARPNRRVSGESVDRRRVLLYPLCGALVGGVALYASGRISFLPLPLVVLPPKLIGTALLTVPMLATGRLRVPRSCLGFVVVPGVTEVAAFFLYAWGARSDIAIAAVLSSTFGAVAGVLGFLVLGERMTHWQVTGVVAITAGVATLSVLA